MRCDAADPGPAGLWIASGFAISEQL